MMWTANKSLQEQTIIKILKPNFSQTVPSTIHVYNANRHFKKLPCYELYYFILLNTIRFIWKVWRSLYQNYEWVIFTCNYLSLYIICIIKLLYTLLYWINLKIVCQRNTISLKVKILTSNIQIKWYYNRE